jgi:hypothetical protein
MTRVNLHSVSWIAGSHPFIIAQEADTGSVLLWAFVLILLIVLGFLGAMSLRKWLAKEEDEPDNPMGFTLGDLRAMHTKGQITTEEFEKAKVLMIAGTKRAADRAAQAAAEAAKKNGGTDIDALRARARLRENPAIPSPPPAEMPGNLDSPPSGPPASPDSEGSPPDDGESSPKT